MEPLAHIPPEAFIAQIKTHPAVSVLAVLTGESGAGKTTWCTRLIEAARNQGMRCSGVISPPVFHLGEKTGIRLVNVSTGESRLLGRLRGEIDPHAPTRKWAFDEAVLAWGNKILSKDDACDLLLVDELGPLEFQHASGLQAGFLALERKNYRLGVAVVRPGLLAAARARWDVHFLIMLEVSPGR